MPQTVITINDPKAVKAFSVALFTKMARAASFTNKMTGPAPKEGDASRKLKATATPAGMPIVEIRDLSKGAGDNASYDIIDILSGLPTMGDKRVSGRMMGLKFGTQNIRIDQMRAGVDSGGTMTRKRTLYDLRMLSMANLVGYNNNSRDNCTLIHLAGARGFQTGKDWSSTPLETHPEFNEILVNPVMPPTFNRRYIIGTGNGISSALDNTDKLTLVEIDKLRTLIDESEYPLQGVVLPGDESDEEDPLFVLRVSPTGYAQLRESSSAQDWNTLVASAVSRASISKHPLFRGTDLLWRNILIKKTRRSVRFATGNSVREYAADGTTLNTVAAPVGFDRAVLLGAQALAWAYGSDEQNGYHLRWHEEKTDHDNRVEVSTSMIAGAQKLTFDLDGVKTDHGVWAVDHFNGL